MGQSVLYVIQPFTRRGNGAVILDIPAYSRDRAFAARLAQTLSQRKHGVLAVGALIDETGMLAPEAEIISGMGFMPTDLIVPHGEGSLDPAIGGLWRVRSAEGL